MTWTGSNPVVVDNATKKDDYDALWDNVMVFGDVRIMRSLGGDPYTRYDDETYRYIAGYHDCYIDGTDFSGITAYWELNCNILDTAATGYARLYNVTLGAAVAGSEVTITATAVTRKTATITLNTASNVYRVQVKQTPGIAAEIAYPAVWGCIVGVMA